MRFSLWFAAAIFISFTGFSQGQFTTYDNYTGQWIDNASWEVGGGSPGYSALGTDNIDIYGYINVGTYGSPDTDLGLKGKRSAQSLIVHDTLVIYGNIWPQNNSMNLNVKNGGVLIIYGALNLKGLLTV
jgi:hypothetical protein